MLIESLQDSDEPDASENLTMLRMMFEKFPELLKAMLSVHGTAIMRMLGYQGEAIMQPAPPEEKVGDKRVVKTMQIGGRTIKVLR